MKYGQTIIHLGEQMIVEAYLHYTETTNISKYMNNMDVHTFG